MLKVAGNLKSCGKLREMAKVEVPQLPQLNCALDKHVVTFETSCKKLIKFRDPVIMNPLNGFKIFCTFL